MIAAQTQGIALQTAKLQMGPPQQCKAMLHSHSATLVGVSVSQPFKTKHPTPPHPLEWEKTGGKFVVVAS